MKVWNRIKIKEILICDVLEQRLSHWHNVWHLCITFDIKFNFRQKDRVIHLTLLSVRKRYRKYGIGKYLLQVCITLKTFWLPLVKMITAWISREHEWERKRERERERETCISNRSMENYFPVHSIYSYISSNVLIYRVYTFPANLGTRGGGTLWCNSGSCR